MGVSSVSFSSPTLRCKKKVCTTKHSRPAKKADLRKRQVQFGNDEIIEFKPSTPLQDKSSLWWTRDERKDILETNQMLARAYRVHHRDNVDRANDVYEACCEDDSSSSSSDDSSDEMSDLLGAKIELPTHVRGLEYGFLPKTKLHRRIHVQEVLQATQEENMSSLDVAAFAVESSRPCVMFAQILGRSDAISAKPTVPKRRFRPRMLPSWW